MASLKKPGVASTTLSLLGVALMQARTQHFWLRKIAVIDCSSDTSETHTNLSAHSAMAHDTDLLILAPLAATPLAQDAENAVSIGKRGKAQAYAAPQPPYKERFQETATQIAEFAPQLLVFLLGNTAAVAPADSSERGAQECEVDGEWVGKWAEGVAATCCNGRTVVCASREALPQFLVGMLQG